jgi:hypothetical protein
MRGMRWAAIGVVAGIMALPPVGSAQGKGVDEEFSAVITNISNVGPTGLTPITIRINRWTPDEANIRLLETLRDAGQDAFLRELNDEKPVGSIQVPSSLKYDFYYARQSTLAAGGRRILLITDRPMQVWERLQGARSREYPFTVVDLRLDKDGNGSGTLAQLVQLSLSGDVLGIENLATAPMKLNDVRKKK